MKYFSRLLILFLLSTPLLATAGEFSINTYTGIQVTEKALVLDDGKCPDMENMDISVDGKSLETRLGLGDTALFDISYPTHAIKSVGFLKNDSYDVLLVGYDKYVETIDKAYSGTIIHSTATAGYTWDFKQYVQYTYGTNGIDDVFYTDGTSTTSIPSAPKGKSIAFFNTTCWIANVSGNKARVYHSVDADPEDWTTGVDPTDANSFNVADFGEEVVDLQVLGNSLLVLCSRSIMKIVGTQNPYQIVEVDKSIGCDSKGSVVTHLGYVYFHASDGQYYRTDGSTVEDISGDDMWDVFDVLALSQTSQSFRTFSSKSDWDAGFSSHTTTSIVDGDVQLSTGTTVYTTSVDWSAFTLTTVDSTTVDGSLVLSKQTTIDQQNTATNGYGANVGSVDHGMSFLVQAGVSITSTTLRLKRTGSPTGNFEVHIYTDDGSGLPSASIGSKTLAGSSISTSFALYSFVFSPIEVSIDTLYHIVCKYPVGSGRYVTWDGYYSNSTNIYPNGKASHSSGGWGFEPEYSDWYFIIYTSGQYVTSGSAISPIIDTTFNTPIWGTLVGSSSTPTSAELGYYARSSTDSAMGDAPAWVAQTNEAQITGIDTERYVQLKTTFTTTDAGYTPQLNDLTLLYSATGYYITSQFTQAEINSWGLLEVDETLNGGTLAHSVFSTNTLVSSTDLQDSTKVTWTAQGDDTTIGVSTDTYLYVKSTFTITSGTQTPTIHAMTVNWISGNLLADDMTASWYEDRLYIGAMETTSSSSNDFVLVYDPDLNAWWKYAGLYPAVFTSWNNKFLVGCSTGGVFGDMFSGNTDFGTDIDCFYTTKHMSVGNLRNIKSFEICSFVYDQQDAGTMYIDYYMNGNTTAGSTYSLDLTGGHPIHIDLFRFPQATNANFINFKVYNSGGDFIQLYSVEGITTDKPLRIQRVQ